MATTFPSSVYGTGILYSLDSDRLEIRAFCGGGFYYTYSGDAENGFIASLPLFGEYGEGATVAEAIKDVQASIVDYYFSLKELAPRIEKETKPAPEGSVSADWENMKTYLEEKEHR